MLPFSEACERNKGPILDILRDVFAAARHVLEIGSGTGQHAVWFARHLPHLQWQPSDRATELPGLRQRIASEGPPNLLEAVDLDVQVTPWPASPADAVFSANTLHIMGWPGVEAFFAGIGTVLKADGATLAVYGPFRYGGDYTSASNAAFDGWLKRRDPASGIRDFEAVDALARASGLTLAADHAMPANNQLLVWRRERGQPA
jgi:cyclopropane fatty-acyl-phospholipid synthase-like methyltransferase